MGKMQTARTDSMLSDYRIRVYWGSLFVSYLGSGIWNVSLPILAFTITGEPATVGGALLARVLPYLMSAPLAAVAVDRLSRTRALVWLSVARGLLFTAVIPIVVFGASGATVGALLAAGFMDAFLSTWYDAAHAGIIKALSSEGYTLQKLNSLSRGTRILAESLGMGLGGLLAVTLATSSILAFNGASFMVAGVGAHLAKLPAGELAARDAAQRWRFIFHSVRYALRNPSIRIGLVALAGLNVLIPTFLFSLPILAVNKWGDAAWAGYLLGAYQIGGLGGTYLASSRFGERATFRWAWLTLTAGGLGLAIVGVSAPMIAFATMLALGVPLTAGHITIMSHIQASTDDHWIGRVTVVAGVVARVIAGLALILLAVFVTPAQVSLVVALLGAGAVLVFGFAARRSTVAVAPLR